MAGTLSLSKRKTVKPATWYQVGIGGGGYVTGIDISNDGTTIVVRTDTAGAFRWDFTNSVWLPLITPASFAGYSLDDRGGGVTEIRVAPSDPTRLYMDLQGDIWVSSNRGTTWTACGLNYNTRAAGNTQSNDTTRFTGQRMAVDPANKDVVYFGTQTSGVYQTANGGSSWSLISTSSIPGCSATISGASPGHPGIAFDPTSGTTGGKTNTIYIPSYGNGVYQSTDAGASWALLSGGPTKVTHAKVAADGIYYASNFDALAANQFYKYSAGWTNISSGQTVGVVNNTNSILCDPSDATRVIAVGADGSIQLSTTRGASWSTKPTVSRVSTDMPWLAWTRETFMSLGDMIFDGSGNIWFAEGIGVWKFAFSGSPSSVAWVATSKGIENLTVNQVLVPPNGIPLAAGWDRSVFLMAEPSGYATNHSPNNSVSIRMAWALDYATSDPTFVAYPSFYSLNDTIIFGYYSTDKGVTWQAFPGFPSGGNIPVNSGNPSTIRIGGCIACSTPQNIIIVPANNALPWYTLDGGATWTEIVISGTPTSGVTGWGTAYYSSTQSVAADRVLANTFYLYNFSTLRCYRSTDGGANWTNMGATVDNQATNFNYRMVSVPGQAGHLFLSGGRQGNPGDANPGSTALQRTTDGGATWTRVGPSTATDGRIKEPTCVGFGAAKPGQSYPAIYFSGWLRVGGVDVLSTYRSFDNCSTWEDIGVYTGDLQPTKTIDGSKENYGEIYVGRSGGSYAYRTPD